MPNIRLKDLEITAASRTQLLVGCVTVARSLRGLGVRRRTVAAAFLLAGIQGRLKVDPLHVPGPGKVTVRAVSPKP